MQRVKAKELLIKVMRETKIPLQTFRDHITGGRGRNWRAWPPGDHSYLTKAYTTVTMQQDTSYVCLSSSNKTCYVCMSSPCKKTLYVCLSHISLFIPLFSSLHTSVISQPVCLCAIFLYSFLSYLFLIQQNV